MQQRIKRGLEFIIALIGVILASPILLIIAILVRIKLEGNSILTLKKVNELKPSVKNRKLNESLNLL